MFANVRSSAIACVCTLALLMAVHGQTSAQARREAVIGKLVDLVSMNGNLLLNLSPMADGTIPEAQQQTLLEVGAWLDANGEAIYGTHNWVKCSEGSGRSGYRFTVKGDCLYAIALTWPGEQAVISSLAAGKAPEGKIESVSLLGRAGNLEFTQDATGLKVRMPAEQPCKHAFALKITGLKMNNTGPTAPAEPPAQAR